MEPSEPPPIEPTQNPFLNLADVCGNLEGEKYEKFKNLLKSADRSNDATTYLDHGITKNPEFVKLVFDPSKSRDTSDLIFEFAGVNIDENRAS